MGMGGTLYFERFHDIVIDAPAAEILNYVSNPKSWPEWIAASHEIDSPDRPLAAGETFRERWATRTGEVMLDWVVTERVHPRLWVAQTSTDFTGTIIIRYEIEPAPGGQRYRRLVSNPARPKAPTEAMIARMDEEAATSLANIKRAVEARRAALKP
jgi:Polyketide cyclase / dehydrase and lipid transport